MKYQISNSPSGARYQNYILKSKIFNFFIVILIFAFYILILPSPVFAQTATLSLSPSSGTFNKGCAFALDIRLDTGGAQTDGTDAILLYDSSRLTATSITSGNIYPDYPGNNIDDTSGKITVSGLASVSSAFSGQGSLAVVNFAVKDNAPAGVTQVKFDFDPNNKAKTTDSNVVQRGTTSDVLSSVVNGNYTIGTGACGTLPATGGSTGSNQGAISSTPSGQQPIIYKTLPPAGTEQLTFTLTIVGVTLTILGILGLALL